MTYTQLSMTKLLPTYSILCKIIPLMMQINERIWSAYLFLRANGVPIIFSDEAFENLVIEVAKGKVTKEEIARFLEHGE